MIFDFHNPMPTEAITYPDWIYAVTEPVEPQETIIIRGSSSSTSTSVGGSSNQEELR